MAENNSPEFFDDEVGEVPEFDTSDYPGDEFFSDFEDDDEKSPDTQYDFDPRKEKIFDPNFENAQKAICKKQLPLWENLDEVAPLIDVVDKDPELTIILEELQNIPNEQNPAEGLRRLFSRFSNRSDDIARLIIERKPSLDTEETNKSLPTYSDLRLALETYPLSKILNRHWEAALAQDSLVLTDGLLSSGKHLYLMEEILPTLPKEEQKRVWEERGDMIVGEAFYRWGKNIDYLMDKVVPLLPIPFKELLEKYEDPIIQGMVDGGVAENLQKRELGEYFGDKQEKIDNCIVENLFPTYAIWRIPEFLKEKLPSFTPNSQRKFLRDHVKSIIKSLQKEEGNPLLYSILSSLPPQAKEEGLKLIVGEENDYSSILPIYHLLPSEWLEEVAKQLFEKGEVNLSLKCHLHNIRRNLSQEQDSVVMEKGLSTIKEYLSLGEEQVKKGEETTYYKAIVDNLDFLNDYKEIWGKNPEGKHYHEYYLFTKLYHDYLTKDDPDYGKYVHFRDMDMLSISVCQRIVQGTLK